MITSFAFSGTGPNEHSGGCSPFLVTYTGARALQEAHDTAATTQQLEQGSQNASLADIKAIKEKERIKFPRDLHHVSITLQRYAVLVQCLFQGLGAPHPFVGTVWALAEEFRTKLPFLLELHSNIGREHPEAHLQLPSRVLRYVQIVAIEYLQRIASAVAGFADVDDVPRFRTLVQDLQWGTFHVSRNWISLPPAYASLAFPPPALSSSNRRAPNGSVGNTTSTTSGSTSVNSGLSSLTSDPLVERQTRVLNPTQDAEFLSLELKPRLGDLLRLHRPPATADGGEHCVSWWAKGACFSQCSRRGTHKAFASPAERLRLLAHIKDHLVVGSWRASQEVAVAPSPASWPPTGPVMSALLPAPSKRPRTLPTLSIPVVSTPLLPREVEPNSSSTSLSESTLGKSAAAFDIQLARSASWEAFGSSLRPLSDISPTVRHLPHKASRLLDHLRHRGAPVPLTTPPWTSERLRRAVRRSPHKSARDHAAFVFQEIQDFCTQGFWTVLPLSTALTLPNVRVSPLGVVPQRDRRPRLIVDYSYSGVNHETVRLAPPEAMQFGRTLPPTPPQSIGSCKPALWPPSVGQD